MIVGITGGIATGKSVVMGVLIRNEFATIDSDVIVSELLSRNQDVISEVGRNFKVLKNGKIDRVLLAKKIFSKEKERQKLNELLHPIVKERIIEKIKELNKPHVFVDVPLLYEAHFEDLFDIVICVYAPDHIALPRLMNRNNISKKDAMKRIQAQMDIEEKKRKADYVIDSSKTIDDTKRETLEVIKSAVIRDDGDIF